MLGFSTIKLAAGAGVLAVIIIGGLMLKRSIYEQGWNDAMTAVAAQNAVAAQVAEEVQTTVDQCFDQGGTWNVTTGNCDPAV